MFPVTTMSAGRARCVSLGPLQNHVSFRLAEQSRAKQSRAEQRMSSMGDLQIGQLIRLRLIWHQIVKFLAFFLPRGLQCGSEKPGRVTIYGRSATQSDNTGETSLIFTVRNHHYYRERAIRS